MQDIALTLTPMQADTDPPTDMTAAVGELAAALGLDALPAARPEPAAPAAATTKGIDPGLVVAGLGLVLSLPGAVLAAMDIAERLAQRPKAARLVAAAQRLRSERRVEVTVATAEGPLALADWTRTACWPWPAARGTGSTRSTPAPASP